MPKSVFAAVVVSVKNKTEIFTGRRQPIPNNREGMTRDQDLGRDQASERDIDARDDFH